jgi:hypothetical protein
MTFTGTGLAGLLHAATIALVGDPGRASVESVRFLPARNETWLNHVGTATPRARLPEALSGWICWAGPLAGFASAANGSAAVDAHQDCETAMAHGLRAGDHCSGSVSPAT